MLNMTGQAANRSRPAYPRSEGAGTRHAQTLLVVVGVLGALAASSCCVAPLALFALGISGAWIANLTQLAPYQPYFIVAAAGCLSAISVIKSTFYGNIRRSSHFQSHVRWLHRAVGLGDRAV
jgi:hypothetical protein